MSYHIKLSRDTIVLVRSLLEIKSNIDKRKRKSQKIVNFYKVIDDTYIVPFFFGRKFMKQSTCAQNPSTINISFTGKLRTKQISVVQDAIKLLNDTRTVLLALRPGFGKTVISVFLVTRFLSPKRKTLVLIKASILQSQWLDSFNNFSDAKAICVPSSSDPKKIRNEFDKAVELVDVIICMYRRVDKIPSNVIASVDILIVDECDEFATHDKVDSLLATTPSYVICATATPEREDGMHRMLRCMVGYNDVQRSQYDPNLTITKINTPFEPDIEFNSSGDIMWSTMVKSLLELEERNIMLMDLVIECVKDGDKIIILTDRIFHPPLIKKMIEEKDNSITVDVMYGDKKSYSDSDVLIATKSKLGRGFDEESFCPDYDGIRLNVLIIAISVKNKYTIQQYIGRVQRSGNPKVFFFVDQHCIHEKHWTICRDLYKDRGATIREICLDEF